MCLFAQFLSFNLKAPSSIANYLSSLHTLHLLTGVQPPDMKHFEVNITMRGLRRRMQHTVRQAAPITPLLLAQIHSLLNFRKKIDVVFWATLLLGFFMMVRASNLVPRARNKWSPVRQLKRSSLSFNKKGMMVKVKWSKTIQFQQRVLDIPVFKILKSILCPIAAIKKVLKISKATDNGPLLAVSNAQVLTYGVLQKKLKQCIAQLGLNKAKYSTHSLCRGAVVSAEKSGVPHDLIKVYGDSRSDAFKRYL